MRNDHGVEATNKALEEALAEYEQHMQGGLWEAGLKIIGLAQKEAPVALGNLRNSAYVRSASNTVIPDSSYDPLLGTIPDDSLKTLEVEVGFYANYAAAVHEDVEQKGKGTPRDGAPGTTWDTGGPKFLEGPLLRNKDGILEILAARSDEFNKEL